MSGSIRAFILFLAIAFVPFASIFLFENPAESQRGAGSKPFNFDIRVRQDAGDSETLIREHFGVSAESSEAALKPIRRAEARFTGSKPGIRIEADPVLGTAAIIAPGDFGAFAMVTNPMPGKDRAEILREFVRSNAALFGLEDIDSTTLKTTANYTNPAGNLSFVHLQQMIDGVPVFGGEIKAGFTPRNEIVRIINGAVPIGTVIAEDFGDRKAIAARYLDSIPTGAVTASDPYYFPLAAGAVRSSWRLLVESGENMEYVVVDAETGIVLWRKNIVEEQTQTATYEVYGNNTSPMRTADSPAPFTPACNSPAACPQPAAIPRTQFTLIGNEAPYAFNNLGWIPDGENRTFGNNVEAGIDRDGTNGIDPNGWAFGNPNRNFVFAYNPAPGIPPPGEEPLPTTQTYPPSVFQQGSVTQAFYTANRWHDETYRLGFTEAAFNFQNDNFGRGGTGADPLSVEVQDSSGFNGANFATPADGLRPRAQMFVWNQAIPDRDGALDAQVLTHELTHGLSNRLHGNANGLTTNMARGMGEGWSDFYAFALLSEPSDPECGLHAIGGYVTYQLVSGFENSYFYGIRRFPTSRRQCVGPNGLPFNPVTFRYLNSDCNTLIGTTTSNPPPSSAYPRGPIGVTTCDQVHNIGEIWSAALWDVRGELIEIHGPAEGNRRALQYITDGMKLSPVNPNMLNSRDAVIAAAAVASPEDMLAVRRGFAIRGMGAGATILNIGSGTNNTIVTESFNVLPNATIAAGFSVSDAIGNNDGYIEPGEQVTVTVPLTNNSGTTLTGITLFSPTFGVTEIYGDIPNGQTVTRSFATTIGTNAPCGGQYQMTFNITSNESASVETRSILTGRATLSATFTNTQALTINDSGATTPYGTSLNVTGLTGQNLRISLELTGLSHTFPGDLDVLLVGPNGQKFIPMSDVGGNFDVVSQTLTLSDFAAERLPSGGQIVGGTFLPTDVAPSDTFPGPAPGAPYQSPPPFGTATFETGFSSSAAALNGAWTLYITDDAATDAGTLAGWKLKFESYSCFVCRLCIRNTRADFDGDGRTDMSVFRPTEGIWYMDRTTTGFGAQKWGLAGDRIVPGDFDGDGRTDTAVFRPNPDPNAPDFYLLLSTGSIFNGISWGLPGDIPVIADYDGDFRDDVAVFRPSDHTFYVLLSAGGVRYFANIPSGIPVTGDFDGDARADFATFDVGGWYLSRSIGNYASVEFTRFGAAGDLPVLADYDGDGRTDIAVFRPSDQTWYIRESSGNTTYTVFGLATDIQVPGDYDGDGRADIAVYRNGVWYVKHAAGGVLIRQFGLADDVPIPKGYLP